MKKNHSIAHYLACFALMLMAPSAQGDLIGYWSFDDQTAEDFSGFGHDGDLMGSVLPSYSGDVPPILGGGFSMSFPGGDSHVLVPHAETLDITQTMTIAAWVKTAANAWDGVIAKNPSDNSAANHAGNYELRVENGSRNLVFLHQQGGENDTTSYAGGVVGDASWQHVAVTAEAGGDVSLYVNGELTNTSPMVSAFATNTNPLFIGSRNDLFTGMDGLIDDVRLYDEVLTAAAITDLVGGEIESYEGLATRGARASSESPNQSAQFAVNSSGLLGKSHGAIGEGSMWLSAVGDASPEITIDLGSVHSLDELRIWNYNDAASLDRGVATFDIYTAGNDAVFGPIPAVTGLTLARAPGTSSDFSEVHALSGVTGRFVKLAPTSNHGAADNSGLAEVLLSGSPVPAGSPIEITEVSASSELVDGFDRAAMHIVNGSGLGYGDSHTLTPDGDMWLSNGTFSEPNDRAPELTFDFGEVKVLDYMKVWNYNESLEGRDDLLGRGVKSMDVYFAGEDGDFSLVYPELELSIAPGETDSDFGEVFTLAELEARYIRFDILSNHNGVGSFDAGDDDGQANFAGLSEVQFFELIMATGLACDFDGNELCDVADINSLLYSGIPDQDVTYDLDADGKVDQDDVTAWLSQAGDENQSSPYLAGDANFDGRIDAADLNVLGVNWQRNNASSWAEGDFNGDGVVDATDLNVVGVNWLAGATAAEQVAVPEPSGCFIWLIAVVCLRRMRLC